MILYLDTSALVKLFVIEPHAETVRFATARARAAATHLIAYAEARAAFARKRHTGEIEPATAAAVVTELDRRWPGFEKVGVDPMLVRRAGHLAEQFGLRGFDSLHLASAEALSTAIGNPTLFRFACFDAALNRAAAELGMGLLVHD